MLKVNSKNFGCPLFVDDDLSLLLLPCFFSDALAKTGSVLGIHENIVDNKIVSKELVERDVGYKTVNIINNRLDTFLQWIEEYAQESKHVSLNAHHNIPDKIINYYLNDVLIDERGVGEIAIQQHMMALNAYYNYLAYTGFTTVKNLLIKPKFKAKTRTNNKSRNAVKYLTPELRSILYQNTNSIRNELLLKTGAELGLRSKENLGLLVNDFSVGTKKYSGMLSLFAMLKSDPEKMEFEYYLQGMYTKSKRHSGGISRVIYIHRDLLMRLKEYYDLERPKTTENTFFVNDSTSERGTPISESRASRVFKDARTVVLEKQAKGLLVEEGQMLEADHTHHVLRHSFGTDKFYEYATANGMAVDDVTPTSQVYLTVARLMGHSSNKQSAPQTTRTYIRSCHIKAQFE